MVHLKTAESINDISFIKNDTSRKGVVFCTAPLSLDQGAIAMMGLLQNPDPKSGEQQPLFCQ